MPLPTTPGHYLYVDAMPGAQPQLLAVEHDGGELVARFEDRENGDALIPVLEMAGEFHPAQ